MTKMAAMYICGKIPLKIFFYAASGTIPTKIGYVAPGTPAHHSVFKYWPLVGLDLFFGKVKFYNIGFYIEKMWQWWIL